jgi:hypothetical protein
MKRALALGAAALIGCGAHHASMHAASPASASASASAAAAARARAAGAADLEGDAEAEADDANVDPPAAHGQAPIAGFRSAGVNRPEGKKVTFDVDALPLADWTEPPAGKGFSLVPVPDGYRLYMRSHIFAEAIVFGAQWNQGAAPVAFSGFTGGPFWQGAPPGCGGHEHGEVPARWSGFSPSNWTDDGIDVEIGEGMLERATCATKAHDIVSARAAAIVRGYVYGLRVRWVGRIDDSGDVLYVFLPRGSQVAAAGDPEAPLEASDSGAFTRLAFSLGPGSAASASVRVSPEAMRLWSTLRSTGSPIRAFQEKPEAEHNLLLDFDVAALDAGRTAASLTYAVPPGADPKAYAGFLSAVKHVGVSDAR